MEKYQLVLYRGIVLTHEMFGMLAEMVSATQKQ